ncbi:hypothetical protein RCC89_11650 [Cytophagaceae bacterium ABcell3]|nr:hypothetical protein RCC89_11650 [Cytophagaceae bacterium ABcell3]
MESEYAKYEIEDGLLFCFYKPGFVIDLAVAKSVVADRHRFSKGKCYAVVIDCRNLKVITKEAREYLSTYDGVRGIKSSAFIVKGNIQKLLINFFVRVHKPALPLKVFTGMDEAVSWIRRGAMVMH